MLDEDLAELYGVETKVLNQAVKRHAKRFPPDFFEVMRNLITPVEPKKRKIGYSGE